MKPFFVLIFSLTIASCNSPKPEVKTDVIQDNTTVTKNDISKINFTDYVLDSKSKKVVDNWKSYTDLETVLTNVQKGDLSYFKNNHEVINAFLKDLKSSVPETLNSTSIQARILALETKLLKLENAINLSFNKQKLLTIIKEFFVSNANLKLQINKKFEKENQRIEKPD